MAEITVEMGGHRLKGEMIVPPYRGRDGGTWSRAVIGGREYEITEVMGEWVSLHVYFSRIFRHDKHLMSIE